MTSKPVTLLEFPLDRRLSLQLPWSVLWLPLLCLYGPACQSSRLYWVTNCSWYSASGVRALLSTYELSWARLPPPPPIAAHTHPVARV